MNLHLTHPTQQSKNTETVISKSVCSTLFFDLPESKAVKGFAALFKKSKSNSNYINSGMRIELI